MSESVEALRKKHQKEQRLETIRLYQEYAERMAREAAASAAALRHVEPVATISPMDMVVSYDPSSSPAVISSRFDPAMQRSVPVVELHPVVDPPVYSLANPETQQEVKHFREQAAQLLKA
jgi:hypothetical protein